MSKVRAIRSDREEEEEEDRSIYVWGSMGYQGVLSKILVASSNLAGDLVSEKFDKVLGVDYAVRDQWVDTGIAGSKVHMVGQCPSVPLHLVELAEEMTIQPRVSRGQAPPLILGHHFWDSNVEVVNFSHAGIQLCNVCIRNQRVQLVTCNAPAPTRKPTKLTEKGGTCSEGVNQNPHARPQALERPRVPPPYLLTPPTLPLQKEMRCCG